MDVFAAHAPTQSEDSSRGRILVVDDHELNLRLLERLLERQGHRVRTTASLAGAELVLTEEKPAMIVLDMHLPDGSGLELTRKLKSQPATALIPILACTAGVMQSDEDQALEAGCDGYVEKPIDMRRFGSLVASMLSD